MKHWKEGVLDHTATLSRLLFFPWGLLRLELEAEQVFFGPKAEKSAPRRPRLFKLQIHLLLSTLDFFFGFFPGFDSNSERWITRKDGS